MRTFLYILFGTMVCGDVAFAISIILNIVLATQPRIQLEVSAVQADLLSLGVSLFGMAICGRGASMLRLCDSFQAHYLAENPGVDFVKNKPMAWWFGDQNQ